MEHIAHVKGSGETGFSTHSLIDHLNGTADLAAKFASEFGAEEWAHIAGIWHDLGKYSREFQEYISRAGGYDIDAHVEGYHGRVDHSTAGAIHAIKQFNGYGRILAYLIAGHHAGLSDWHGAGASLSKRLEQPELLERVEKEKQNPTSKLLDWQMPFSKPRGGSDGFALWIRMLFSCLVDADFLDTEDFFDEEKGRSRQGYPALEKLLPVFNGYMEKLGKDAGHSKVNRIRADVLRQCRERANSTSGIFSLTVPTGGGKTLASLAFALEHAIRHGKKRVIYAIPYTSIIEQTADVFKEVFEPLGDVLVEHHSNIEFDETKAKSRLAAENWDVPLIVTTNVQFFESLFASRTSRCRKLHNIVNSVVVLDEAQLIPPEFLQPIVDTINLLSRHYGVTFLFSTATQPALNMPPDPFGRTLLQMDKACEIISDVDKLYDELKRVTVTLPADMNMPSNWDDLAKEIRAHDSVLAIVNRRKECRELWERLPEGTVHLSGLMCGEHRSSVIKDIKQRLKDKKPTRVISTQLVEAGVDLDFPVVYRALAGLDSMAQAAGRCNREGKMDVGKVVIFIPPQAPPIGLLRFGADAAKEVLHNLRGSPLDRALCVKYFRTFLDKPDLDQHGIEKLLKPGSGFEVQFRTAAKKFRLIDDRETQTVFVRYNDKSGKLLNLLQNKEPERWILRKLQRHSVTLYKHDFKRLLDDGGIVEIQPGLYAQAENDLYDDCTGLSLYGTMVKDPTTLLV